MFGKAKKQSADEAVKETARGLTIIKLSMPPIILVVLVVLVCGYFAYVQYAGLVKQAQQVQHVADAEKMAALLGGRLVALGEQVAMQARADTELATAIDGGDREVLRRFEAGLLSYFPEAVRIRVVRPEDTNPDPTVFPPIGYACLDLARQAEAGSDRPPLELHLHGSKGAHLDLVRPIVRDGEVIASLMVSFSEKKVDEWLNELVLETGYVELQQGWEGPILGSIGAKGLKRDAATHRSVISGSSWQLSYWADSSIGIVEAKKLGFLTIFAVAAVVVAALMFFYALFLSATIKRELQGMTEFMVESGRGKRFHSYPVKMMEMEAALKRMEPVLGWINSSDDVKGKAEEGDGGASDLMFMDFGEISVEEPGEDESPKGEADKS